jgi:AcrR family transcriptional regulator
MENTKQKILNTSRRLFNDLGYGQVTIRMIAQELSMSSGNLNYHFRKREDILEALYAEMVAIFDARVQAVGDHPISLVYIDTGIRVSMDRMIEYRFFWMDLHYLLKANKKIRTHFERVKNDRINGYAFVFQSLIRDKVLTPPSFPQEHELLIKRMIDYSNTWLYASSLYEIGKKQNIIEEASFSLMSMLYPYLTVAGQETFRAIYPGNFPDE